MPLRTTILGSDGCTANGAGPSNAMGQVADTLLGTASKSRSQLHEYAKPEVSTVPSPQATGKYSISDAVDRLAGRKDIGTRVQQHVAPADPVLRAFEDAFLPAEHQGARTPPQLSSPLADRQRGFEHFQPPPQSHVYENLHHFLRTSLARHDFTPLAHLKPRQPLSLPDQLRVRDRGTILARHLHADAGDAYADTQLAALLHSLGIDPSSLPAKIDPAAAAAPGGTWDTAWNNAVSSPTHPTIVLPEPPASASNSFMHSPGLSSPMRDQWASEFANMSLSDKPRAAKNVASPTGASWSTEFVSRNHPGAASPLSRPSHLDRGNAWASEYLEDPRMAIPSPSATPGKEQLPHPGSTWADEFSVSQAHHSGTASSPAGRSSARMHSRRLMDVLSRDPSEKFQKSQFLQFLSKMSQGDVDFQNGRPEGTQADSWATEFSKSRPVVHDDATDVSVNPSGDGWNYNFPGTSTGADWAAEFSEPPQLPTGSTFNVDDWADDFSKFKVTEEEANQSWASAGAQGKGPQVSTSAEHPYQFQLNNPYDGNAEASSIAQAAFASGSLGESCLALEAVVKANPRVLLPVPAPLLTLISLCTDFTEDAQAWRLLGVAHAENDNDQQAIAAMLRALDAAPDNADVLLSLGVSHVNELHEGEAVGYLLRWLRMHPHHSAVVSDIPLEPHLVTLSNVHGMFSRAAEASPPDADVQTGLGVIAHLAGDYTQATEAFEAALQLRPKDYSLWNKLGATLANSGRSQEAKGAYAHALRLKSNYMRAWSNMGISHSNLGEYGEAAQFFVKALSLNGGGESVWGYLHTAVVMTGDHKALELVHARNLPALVQRMGVADGQRMMGRITGDNSGFPKSRLDAKPGFVEEVVQAVVDEDWSGVNHGDSGQELFRRSDDPLLVS